MKRCWCALPLSPHPIDKRLNLGCPLCEVIKAGLGRGTDSVALPAFTVLPLRGCLRLVNHPVPDPIASDLGQIVDREMQTVYSTAKSNRVLLLDPGCVAIPSGWNS